MPDPPVDAWDLLAGIEWVLVDTAPGEADHPSALAALDPQWIPAQVPGTVAGALRAAGRWTVGIDDEAMLDGRDWWYRARIGHVPNTSGEWSLAVDGLATISDVWVGGSHLLHSENMFVRHQVDVAAPADGAEIHLRFAALGALLSQRHPRPRWKSKLVRTQSLRWYRTSMLGRMPGWSAWAAPVGPWRTLRLSAGSPEPSLIEHDLEPRVVGEGGRVQIQASLRCPGGVPVRIALHVGDETCPLVMDPAEGGIVDARGVLELAAVERWWPHTHGAPNLYRAWLEVDAAVIELGRIGFRTIDVDQQDGRFTVVVNGEKIFCRGACWNTPDAVSFTAGSESVRARLENVREAGMNMLRVAGYTHYEDETFWDLCDELGILVWQDAMIAGVDPPETPDFETALTAELRPVMRALQRHPALAVFCGSSESYQQAAMYGLPPERWHNSILDQVIPELLELTLPGTPYVPSSPCGGDMPFSPDSGISHYFGVGPYLRPLADARLAEVRFATECLAFAIPPEPRTVAEVFGAAAAAGHAPQWKNTVARDASASWDYEDARDHYVRTLFGVDPLAVRYSDPEYALDLGRAAIVHAMSSVLTDWRRTGSPCDGALILTLQDMWPGAGWGLLDSLGRPKAPWYAVSRVFAPCALLMTDDGLSGLRVHAVNDGPSTFSGTVRLTVFTTAGTVSEAAEYPVRLEPHTQQRLSAERWLGGFRDLTRAYRFAPITHDVVLAELVAADGTPAGTAVHLPGGIARSRLPDLGLTACATETSQGWTLTVSTRHFAQYVAIDVAGFSPSDSWFHLAPGRSLSVRLIKTDRGVPRGHVRALNAQMTVPISISGVDDAAHRYADPPAGVS